MQTAVPGVYAAGDANGKVMSAHAAYRESVAAINNILGRADRIDYLAIPQVVFTFSEAASIGETLESALAKGIDAVCGEAPLRSSGRFFAEGGQDGFCKIISENTSGRLLGVHIAGGNASELIYGAAAMLASKMTVEEIKIRRSPPHGERGDKRSRFQIRSTEMYDKQFRFNEDGEFKILLFGDPHENDDVSSEKARRSARTR